MFARRNYESENLFRLRAAARLSAAVCLSVLFLLLLGEDAGELWTPSAGEFLRIVFFPVGVMTGLLLGWRRESAGGALALGSLLAFYVVYSRLSSGALTGTGWWFAFFATPGALFLVYGIAAAGKRREISQINKRFA